MQSNYKMLLIIVISDTILAMKWIFNIFVHPYQLYFIAISKDHRCFFNKNPNDLITC